MFSSNQILDVSGSLDQINDALTFAMGYSGQLNHFSDAEQKRGCKIVFQITKDGKYCIGWGFQDVPYGWTEYQFKPDIKIISAIIEQRLNEVRETEGVCDGSYERGFRMRQIDFHTEGVENPFYGLVYFEPYTCFYAK